MNGWMFFPAAKNGNQNQPCDVLYEVFPGIRRLSREEWNTFLPESRESRQGCSIGFLCGGRESVSLMRRSQTEQLPFPMAAFVSDFVILPFCWTCRKTLSAAGEPKGEYRILNPPAFRPVITVTGTLPDRPPSLRVCGSYCFFPPPYRCPPLPDLVV